MPVADASLPLSRRQRWKRRLKILLAIYLILMVLSFPYHLADRLVLFPTKNVIRLGSEAHRRMLPVPGGELEIITTRSGAARETAPQAFILEFPGNATRAEQIAERGSYAWRDYPVEVWAVNYPGYGASSGPARLKSIADAALAAYDAMHREANGRPMIVVGTSLGTTAALHVAANRSVAGLVLMNPPPLRQLIRGEHGWWNLWLVAVPVSFAIPPELDSLANARRCTAPAIFITSGADDVVPLKYQQRITANYPGPKRVLLRKDANHNDGIGEADQGWMIRQRDWLWQNATRTVAR